MPASANYKIAKIEKGPLQRFKNQNLLLKKFGEVGLQIYKAITGKRTSEELRKDLDIDSDIFSKVLAYMQEAGMVELAPLEGGAELAAPKKEEKEEEIREPPNAPEAESPPAETEMEKREEEERNEEKEEAITFEEIRPVEEKTDEEASRTDKKTEDRIEEEPAEAPPKKREEKKKPEEEKEEELRYEEIQPVAEEGAPAEEEEVEARPVPQSVEEEFSTAPEKRETEAGEELTPVERIIKEKYGDVGLRVYILIDGRRTAEQIMKETGLTEAKLVEILDFMDEQGIIKLEYPKDKRTEETTMPATMEKEEFAPMLAQEEEEELLKATVDVPAKLPIDILKGVQMRTTILLKQGDKGGRLFDQIDGKKDLLDLALVLRIPLYTADSILKFFLQQGIVRITSMTREEVKKKYGDDGYAVYKRYGKEGLMLYELIGKEMTIKQMADMVSTDKQKMVEMFLFIHKVLGIDLPIDKEVLFKQLEV